MIVRVRRNKTGGLAKYLRDGVKKDSNYSRNEKDIVIPIWGNLDEFEKIEDYVLNEKKFSDVSMHITFGFSDTDWQMIESLPTKDEQNALMQELVQDYIEHHFSGYHIDKEIISYSELHYPRIKYDEHGNKRYPHIHLAVSFLNLLSDTKLRNLFARNSYYDEIMVRKSNFKFGFEQTKRKELRVKNFESQVGRDRKEWIELFDDLNDRQELIYFLENQMNFKENVDYRVVDTKNNNYVKIINKSYKTDKSAKKIVHDINLQGRGFERFVDVNSDAKNHKKLEDMTQDELEEILNDVYEKRVEEIGKRRSKKATEDLKKIYEEDKKLEQKLESKYTTKDKNIKVKNFFKNLSFQQQIFYKKYQTLIEDRLEGYYINVDDLTNITTFENRVKKINVTDLGNEIESDFISSSNYETVKLMLDIAVAKGWNLLDMEIEGCDEFVAEAKKQILSRINESNMENKNYKDQETNKKIIRPISYLDNLILDNESKIVENEKVNDIEYIKKYLKANIVLEFAKKNYNINLDEFEIVDSNKINNITNKQKAKSVIDFFTKEIGIGLKEAIEISNKLLNSSGTSDLNMDIECSVVETINQLNIKVDEVITKNEEVVDDKPLSITKKKKSK